MAARDRRPARPRQRRFRRPRRPPAGDRSCTARRRPRASPRTSRRRATRVLEFDDERDGGRPRGQERGESGIRERRVTAHPRTVAPDLGRNAEEDRPQPIPEPAKRLRQPRHALLRRPGQGAERRAALRLDGEAEVGWRCSQPAGDRRCRRPTPERRVQLQRRQARRVDGQAIGRARAGGVEARRPVGVGEPRRADEEAAGRPVRQARSREPQARSATDFMVRSTVSMSSPSIADRK